MPSELATNGIGGYATNSNRSRFDGVFFFDGKMMKVLEDVKNFYLPKGINCILLDTDRLIFDIRESYSNPEWGRHYEISVEDDLVIIKFTLENEYACYCALKIDGTYDKVEKYYEVEYEYDKMRGSFPYKRWVFHALNIRGKAKLSFSFSKETAKRIINEIKGVTIKKSENPFELSKNALDSFACTVNGARGIYAGLPWFFQFWSRDELISLGGLISQNKKTIPKEVIMKYLYNLNEDGRIPNRVPESMLGSADGIGWLFKRINDLLKMGIFSEQEKHFITLKGEFIVDRLLKNYFKGGLVYNRAQETWMDTTGDTYDTREGCRIEIQALYLILLNTLNQAGGKYREIEEELMLKTRHSFWNGKLLADGIDDLTQRPNIFIAYYLYPQLLKNDEWALAFESALNEIWLPWGGLSTISKYSSLYQRRHTGENNRSYHRGDSWYWVNNLAALCMHRVDKTRFQKYIHEIYSASVKDILEMGYYGYHSEISSADVQEPFGCFAQSWSSSTFIELSNELNKN